MAKIDLKKLLLEIVDAYGENGDYTIPTIAWSKDNMYLVMESFSFGIITLL